MRDKYKDDPKFVFYEHCYNIDKQLFLPLLDHVHEKTLCLEGYTLSIGHCNALVAAFEHFSGFINRVILDNCGVDDVEFTAILVGIRKLQDFKKIVYRRNIFQEGSLKAIQDVFERQIPHHLEELRIENCTIDAQVTRALLESMTGRSYLKKFGLVDGKLNN